MSYCYILLPDSYDIKHTLASLPRDHQGLIMGPKVVRCQSRQWRVLKLPVANIMSHPWFLGSSSTSDTETRLDCTDRASHQEQNVCKWERPYCSLGPAPAAYGKEPASSRVWTRPHKSVWGKWGQNPRGLLVTSEPSYTMQVNSRSVRKSIHIRIWGDFKKFMENGMKGKFILVQTF